MFYSQLLLAKKGALGKVWLAAHYDKRLTKAQIANTDIKALVASVAKPQTALSLRVSAHLLLGLSKIFQKQVAFLFVETSEALGKLRAAFRTGGAAALPAPGADRRADIDAPDEGLRRDGAIDMGGAAGGKAGAGGGGVDLALGMGGMFDFGAGDDGGFGMGGGVLGMGMGPLLDGLGGDEYFTVGSQQGAGRASQGTNANTSAARRRGGVDLLGDDRSGRGSERGETEDEDGGDSRGRLNKSSAGRSSVSDVELLRRGAGGAASVDGSLASGASAVRRGGAGMGLDGAGGLDDDRGSVYSSDTGGADSVRARERARRAARASLGGAELDSFGLGLGGAGAGGLGGGASAADMEQMKAMMDLGGGMGGGFDMDMGLGGLGGLDGFGGGDDFGLNKSGAGAGAGAGGAGNDAEGVDQGGNFDVDDRRYDDNGDGYGAVDDGAGAGGAGSSPANAADAEMNGAGAGAGLDGIDASAGAFAATDADVAAARAAEEARRKAAKEAREAQKAARAATRKEKRDAQLREAAEAVGSSGSGGAGAGGLSGGSQLEDTQLVLTGDQIRAWLGDTRAITKPALDKGDHRAVAAWSRRLAAGPAAGVGAKSRAWLDSVLGASGGSGAFDADIAAAVTSGGAFAGLFAQQAAAAPPVKAVGGAALAPADAALLAATSAMAALSLVPKDAPAAAGMRALLAAATAAVDARLIAPAGSLLSSASSAVLPGVGLSCFGPEVAALSAVHLAGRSAYPQMPTAEQEPQAQAGEGDAEEEAEAAEAGPGAGAGAGAAGKAGKGSAARSAARAAAAAAADDEENELNFRDDDGGAGYGAGEDGEGVDQGGNFDVDDRQGGGDLALESDHEQSQAEAERAGAATMDAAMAMNMGMGMGMGAGFGLADDEFGFGVGGLPSPAPSAGGASRASSGASSASKLRTMSAMFNPNMVLGAEGTAAGAGAGAGADGASGSAPGSAARGAGAGAGAGAVKGTPSSAASDAGSSVGAGTQASAGAGSVGSDSEFSLRGRWPQQTKAMLQILASEMTGPLTKEAAEAAAAAAKPGRKRRAGEMEGGADAAAVAALGPDAYDLTDLAHGRGTAEDPVSFLGLADGADRRQVALSFFQVLQLKTWSVVEVAQGEPYGDIGVARTERFAKALQEVNRGMH